MLSEESLEGCGRSLTEADKGLAVAFAEELLMGARQQLDERARQREKIKKDFETGVFARWVAEAEGRGLEKVPIFFRGLGDLAKAEAKERKDLIRYLGFDSSSEPNGSFWQETGFFFTSAWQMLEKKGGSVEKRENDQLSGEAVTYHVSSLQDQEFGKSLFFRKKRGPNCVMAVLMKETMIHEGELNYSCLLTLSYNSPRFTAFNSDPDIIQSPYFPHTSLVVAKMVGAKVLRFS